MCLNKSIKCNTLCNIKIYEKRNIKFKNVFYKTIHLVKLG